jgi:nucleotide-binding universal stress UspA family protein
MTPPLPLVENPFLSDQAWRRLEAGELRAARRRLASLQRQARRAGVAVSSRVVRSGRPFAAIVEAARRRRADLIVLGTQGRSGVRGAVLGSVAERVASHARCPVLTVRA